jgi:hypothetical protein
MVRPGTFYAPGLDSKTDAAIKKILRRWSKSQSAGAESKGKSKKRK